MTTDHATSPFLRLTGDDCRALSAETRAEVFVWARANGVTVNEGDYRETPVVCITVTHHKEGPPKLYVKTMSNEDPLEVRVVERPMTTPLPAEMAAEFTPVRHNPVDVALEEPPLLYVPAPPGWAPPAARDLPGGALDSAVAGASALDAMALSQYGRNLLAHALTRLQSDGWLAAQPQPDAGQDQPEPERAR